MGWTHKYGIVCLTMVVLGATICTSCLTACAQSFSQRPKSQKNVQVKPPDAIQVAPSRGAGMIWSFETLSEWVIFSLERMVTQRNHSRTGITHYDLFSLDDTAEKILIGDGKAKLTVGKKEIVWQPTEAEWAMVRLAYLTLLPELKKGELTDLEVLRSYYPIVEKPEKVTLTIYEKRFNGQGYTTLNGSFVKWTVGQSYVTEDGSRTDVIVVEREKGKGKEMLLKLFSIQ